MYHPTIIRSCLEVPLASASALIGQASAARFLLRDSSFQSVQGILHLQGCTRLQSTCEQPHVCPRD